MKKRVKKGSSLLLVIILMGIISILGVSISGLALVTYRSRAVNSTSKINLYAAEAGIEEVYGIIGRYIDKAIEYANEKVEEADLEQVKIDKIGSLFGEEPNFYKLTLDGKKSLIAEENTIQDPSNLSLSDIAKLDLDNNGEVVAFIDDEQLKAFQNQQFQKNYKEYLNKDTNIEWPDTYEKSLKEALEDTNSYSFTLSNEINNNFSKPHISFTNWEPFSSVIGNNKPYKMTLKSEFLDSKLGIKRTIEAEYQLQVPNYNDIYYVKNIEFPKNILWEKAIAADGDMDVNSSDIEITGDVFIKGTAEGGINLKGISPKINLKNGLSAFESKLATRENINLKGQNSEVISEGNIYANNAIIHKEGIYNADGSSFKVTNPNSALFLRDDLELNANNSKIDLAGGFFGLYDGSDKDGVTSMLGNEKSSSIVINSDDIESGGSSLRINGEVIIQGTAYIQTSPEYQTGESISIKGNYKAYTRGLTLDSAINKYGKSLKNEDVIFEYRDPLSVVSYFSDNSALTGIDKSNYFKAYNDEFYSSGDEADRLITSGVYMDPSKIISSAGAVINNGDIIVSELSLDEDKIKKKTEELKRNIFYMGDKTISDTDVYAETNVKRDVTSLLDSDMLIKKTKAPINKSINKNDEIVLLDGNNTNYAFIGENGSIPSEVNSDYRYNIIDGEFKGIIVTTGDIYLSGKLDFSGTIITKGDIIFLDSDKKNIAYDEKLVKKLVASNYEIFNNTFDSNTVLYEEMGKDNKIYTDFLKNKIIKRTKWKVLK